MLLYVGMLSLIKSCLNQTHLLDLETVLKERWQCAAHRHVGSLCLVCFCAGLWIQWPRSDSWTPQGQGPIFLIFPVNACSDSSVSVSPSCKQRAPSATLVLNIPCPPFNKRRLDSCWYGNTQIMHNGSRITGIITVAAPNGRKRRHPSLTFMSCDLNFSLFMDLTAFFSSSRLMYSFSPSDSGLPEETNKHLCNTRVHLLMQVCNQPMSTHKSN